MHLAYLSDPRLLFITIVAGAVSMLTTLNVAARPAAVQTGRVALAFTIQALFFLITRFAGFLYLPLLAVYVDRATAHGGSADALTVLAGQIQVVMFGAVAGAFMSCLLMPTFVEVYVAGMSAMERYQSMAHVLLRFLRPHTWGVALRTVRRPTLMGVKLGHLDGIPAGFLIWNILATAIWTAGGLCASLASAREPKLAATAVLLSGMVNAFALIAFTVWVDPQAALITDQAIAGQRPKEHVTITAVHLSAGNFIGAALGLLVLEPGTRWIQWLTVQLGSNAGSLTGSLWLVIGLNAFVTLLSAAANMDRVSAVLTKRVATALAVYNVFLLVTNVSKQIYMPVLGTLRDYAVAHNDLASLESSFRLVIYGASLGVFIGILLMPTFIEIYCKTIRGMERYGSLHALFVRLLLPRTWVSIFRCLRRPSLFGIRLHDLKTLPSTFIWANIVVIAINTVGVISAIYAGAQLSGHLGRTATLLSSPVNGLALIALSIIVNPTAALITDQCVSGERKQRQIYAMAVFLTVGMLIGTLLSQLVFVPAAWVIEWVAQVMEHLFNHV